MVEYIRGIKAGLASGVITGIIFSIITVVLIYQVSSPMFVPETRHLDIQDNGLAIQVIMPILITSVLIMLILSIFSGTLLGLIVSFIIPKIKIKTIYIVTITSMLFFLISFLTILRIIYLKAPITIEYTLIFVIFITLFAVVEGIILDHFWNRFKCGSSQPTFSVPP